MASTQCLWDSTPCLCCPKPKKIKFVVKPKKMKFNIKKKFNFMDELDKPPKVGTTSRLQLDKNLEALERRSPNIWCCGNRIPKDMEAVGCRDCFQNLNKDIN